MSETKKVASNPEEDQLDIDIGNIAESPGDLCSVSGSVKNIKHSSTSERKIKFERAQKCLENAALVSKRIKEHRKAAAELLGKPFEDDVGDTASEMASTMSERTGYSVATDKSTTLSVQDALNIPGISESLANTLKQKELLMERIKLYKEINKRPPAKKSTLITKKDPDASTELKQNTQNVDVTKLVNTVKEKDNALSVMQVKMRAMETTILDLQEKINEKDQIIEAKNRATTLMSDSLSKKDKDSMDLLEDTKQQMTKMQQYFVAMESEWKDDKARLLKQIEEKNEKIVSLEEANTILENSRFEISVAHSKLAEELDSKNKEILELQERIEELSITEHAEKEKEHNEEEKGSIEIAEMVDLTKKVELLEQLNYQIRQTNKELESQLALMTSESKVSTVAAGVSTKKGSPVTHRKGGRGMKSKSPWSNLSPESMQDTEKKTPKHDNSKSEMILQSLNKEILDKEYLISQKEELISQLKSANDQKDATISDLKLCLETQKESSIEKVDICISTDIQSLDLSDSDIQLQVVPSRNLDAPLDDPESIPMGIKELEQKFKDAQVQIKTLTEEIDAANKNMIKVKSSSKLKVKQMQKTIDNFSKVSDSNAEIVKLNEELHQLSQKVAELEEEKGNLQLHLVDYDSGRLTESDVYKKLVEMENLAETRLKSISLLETQKFDLVQELHVLQQQNIDLEDKLADMSQLQNDQVCSEIKSVQLEEQIDELLASKKELELIIQNLKLDKEQSIGTIQILQEEKNDLIQKLDNYIQENIELTDKLEKLSAEKVSSAESIEIVESLTTQEKLELEEYNKGLSTEKTGDEHLNDNYTSDSRKCDENIENLVKQSAELNEKVELFTNERQEVMDKMNMISVENESLHMQINELNTQCNSLRTNIELLTEEKHDLKTLNDELNQEIEELKRERVEIIKETVEIVKPLNLDENLENLLVESNEEKSGGDKGNNRSTKSVKQLTKEILKLKNTIKEREAEIADSQMKILSLEEQQQKQNEIKQNSVAYDDKIKHLVEENNLLKKEIIGLKDSVSEQDQVHSQEGQFQEEMNKLHQEYSAAINTRESRIQELENLLKEYEKQTLNYINSLQQKDKEITEYINQITKLNDVSQKLKSTIDLLEEEKAKDQNAEVVKSLNKQISIYQKTLSDYEEKLKSLEDEKAQLSSLKAMLEKKSNNLESELKNLHDRIAEKETLIKELTMQQQKNAEEFSSIKIQAKEQDEEIHEIKLQLRKESIENEKLRTTLQQKDNEFIELRKSYDERKDNVEAASNDYKNLKEQYTATESKNKELMEKLKKYAINFKKKSAMFTDLESQFNDLQKDLENKNQQVEQLMIQVESIPALQEKLKVAEEEFYRLQSERTTLEQNAQEIETLRDQHAEQSQVVIQLNEALNQYSRDLNFIKEENANLQAQNDYYSKKIVEYEIEQKNNTNLLTKILCLEADIAQKQMHVEELSNELKNHEEKFTQTQFAHDAKVQECELYIESLQTEIEKYKARISRLEDSISVMEERRHSLERKADQLDGQLQEKQTAYAEYSYQEDELVSRLATLMDHDRVIEKQLFEIESENQELHYKIQYLRVEYQQLQNTYSDLQDYCKILELKVSKIDSVETDVTIYQSKITDLESTIRRLTNENMTLSAQKKSEIEELELEFNTQIENAIKDKKILSEKYEMLREKENLLESKLQEYVTNLENLKINMNDLTKENQNLMERSMLKEKDPVPDYTEQYIAEINNLNSVINSRNEEISSLKSKIENLQAHGLESKNNFEANMSDVTEKLQQVSSEVDSHVLEINSLKDINKELMFKLSQKEEQIKQLVKEKRLVFEMNIPKTEGLMISSTIEALSDDKVPDMSDLMSQIVSNPGVSEPDPEPLVKKKTKNTDSQQVSATSVEGVVEPPMISKKSFLCYDNDEPTKEEDPFNSEEGWGMDLHDETMDVTPGLSDLNRKIEILNQENQKLRADLDNNNTKLLKALKKLKELKASNDMLTNELKISKQISQSSMLDMAIESEMSNNVQELERKIEELNANIAKEKREKESLKKQNDVFKDANDRLTEIKEKMDNEIEVWKYNFKQANDKVSTLQWGTESKYNPTEHSNKSSLHTVKGNESKEELIKLETENEELQALVDKLSIENKELSTKLEQMKEELNNLGIRLSEPIKCANCESMQIQLAEFQKLNEVKEEKIVELQEKISNLQIEYDESIRNCKEENSKLLEQSKTSFLDNISSLQKEIERFKISESEAANTITTLTMDLHDTKLWLEKSKNFDMERIENASIISETCKTLEERCNSLENQLENANFAVLNVTTENNELIEKLNTCDFEIKELNEKLQYANTEKSVIIQSELDHANQSISSLESLNNELLQKIQLNEEKIKELQDKLQYANTEQNILIQSELEHAKQSISNLESLNNELLQKIQPNEDKIKELEDKLQNLNSENDQLLSTVAELRSSTSSAIDQRGFEIAELWKQHLAQRESEFQKIEQELRTQVNASENKYEQLLDRMQSSSQEETEKIIMVEQVTSLQNKIHEKEEHLTSLQAKYADVIHQLDLMRSEMEDEKLLYENKMLGQQEENDKIMQELTVRNEKLTSDFEIALKAHENELSTIKATNDNLNKQIGELRNAYEMKIMELTRVIQIKDSEIYQKAHEFGNMLKQRNSDFEYVRTQLIEYERKLEEIGFEKESELALLRLKMHDTIDDFEDNIKKLEAEKSSLEEALNSKIIECTNQNKEIADLNKSLEEYSNKITEMEVALENQEIEIVTLKDEVSSLNDIIRASSSKIEKHVTFASDTKHGAEGEQSETLLNRDLLDAVPRAELDLALYMLHQRDVRCEELTMELTQLLEERDTLQLRLSDSIRSLEELKLKSHSGLDVSSTSGQDTISDLPSTSLDKDQQFVDTHRSNTSRSSSISDPDGDRPKLQAKLTELRSVKQSRDVRLRHDSEQRQLGMRLLQRDVANLPPEAVDQLNQAHHTLTRDAQSTPTVLLNWLRGKSTPKVVHM